MKELEKAPLVFIRLLTVLPTVCISCHLHAVKAVWDSNDINIISIVCTKNMIEQVTYLSPRITDIN